MWWLQRRRQRISEQISQRGLALMHATLPSRKGGQAVGGRGFRSAALWGHCIADAVVGAGPTVPGLGAPSLAGEKSPGCAVSVRVGSRVNIWTWILRSCIFGSCSDSWNWCFPDYSTFLLMRLVRGGVVLRYLPCEACIGRGSKIWVHGKIDDVRVLLGWHVRLIRVCGSFFLSFPFLFLVLLY